MAGFQLSKTQGASGYTGKVRRFFVDSGDAVDLLAIGDAVIFAGGADANGVASVDLADGTADQPIIGVVVGIEPNLSALETKGLPASTDGYVFVQVDRDALYEIEIIGGTLSGANIDTNYDIAAAGAGTAGNLVRSGMRLNQAVAGAGATLRLVGLVPPTDGTVIGAVGNLAIASINASTLNPT